MTIFMIILNHLFLGVPQYFVSFDVGYISFLFSQFFLSQIFGGHSPFLELHFTMQLAYPLWCTYFWYGDHYMQKYTGLFPVTYVGFGPDVAVYVVFALFCLNKKS